MSWDSTWENVFTKQEWGKYPPEELIRFIAKNFYNLDRKNVKILEVGCGPGANIWYISREGFSAYGIDASPTAIKKASKRLADENLCADLKIGDIIKLPYENGYFDAVIDNECIYCNSNNDSIKILGEIRRVLKNGGLFYSRTFTDEMESACNGKKIEKYEYSNVSTGIFAEKGYVRLTSRDCIDKLYSSIFKINSIDRLEYTVNNGTVKISEWVIVCRKEIHND